MKIQQEFIAEFIPYSICIESREEHDKFYRMLRRVGLEDLCAKRLLELLQNRPFAFLEKPHDQ